MVSVLLHRKRLGPVPVTKLKRVSIPRFCGYDLSYYYGEDLWVNLALSKKGKEIATIRGYFVARTQLFLWEFGGYRSLDFDLLELET